MVCGGSAGVIEENEPAVIFNAGKESPAQVAVEVQFDAARAGPKLVDASQQEWEPARRPFRRRRRAHAPGAALLAAGQGGPDVGGVGGMGQDQAEDRAAADQAVIPPEIMVQSQLECFGFSGNQSLPGAPADFGLQASPAQGAEHAVIGKEEGLGPLFLGAGTFGAGDDAEGKTRVLPQLSDDLFKKMHHKRSRPRPR